MRFLALVPILLLTLSCTSPRVEQGSDNHLHEVLASRAESQVYTARFWLEAAHRRDRRWGEALAVCRRPKLSNRPNCRTILRIQKMRAIPGLLE